MSNDKVIDIASVRKKKHKAEAQAEDLVKISSSYKRKHDRVHRSIKKDPTMGSIKMLKQILLDTHDLLPIAKEIYKQYKGERAAYAYSALVNQSREVAAELRALSDKSEIPHKILTEIIDTSLAEIVQTIQSNNKLLSRQIHAAVKDPKERKHISRQIEEGYLSLIEGVRSKREIMKTQLGNIFEA